MKNNLNTFPEWMAFEEPGAYIMAVQGWANDFEAELREMATEPRMYEFTTPHPLKIIQEILGEDG